MQIAFLFAGQGHQPPGMGAELAGFAASRAIFEAAERAVAFPLRWLMAEGPEAELNRTAVAQPALLTLAYAHAQHLLALGIRPDVFAGHSLGQATAIVAAGATPFEDGVRLVAARGRLMQETVPEGEGAMVAVIGLDRDDVRAACDAARALGVVAVACHNAPGLTVISGAREAVQAAAAQCEEEGAGLVPLTVSAPFHCELLLPMVPPYAALVEATPFVDPAIPIMDNVTNTLLRDAAAVRASLVDQLVAPVLFEENLRALADLGVRHFIQCGPGKSVLNFARRTLRGVTLETFDEAVARVTAGGSA